MPVLNTIPATIAASGSLSGEADLYPGILVGVWMPAVWTAASITFQTLSPDGSTWLERKVVSHLAANMYRRQDWYLFSLVRMPEDKLTFVGLFGNWFKLPSMLPPKKAD